MYIFFLSLSPFNNNKKNDVNRYFCFYHLQHSFTPYTYVSSFSLFFVCLSVVFTFSSVPPIYSSHIIRQVFLDVFVNKTTIEYCNTRTYKFQVSFCARDVSFFFFSLFFFLICLLKISLLIQKNHNLK